MHISVDCTAALKINTYQCDDRSNSQHRITLLVALQAELQAQIAALVADLEGNKS